MKILFDNGTPKPIARSLSGHEITYARKINLTGRTIALVVLGNQQWPLVWLHLDRIADAVNACTPGSCTEVEIPFA